MNTSSAPLPGQTELPSGAAAAHQRARAAIGMWAGAANQAVQQLTVRKYALPDKNVASQILMYRQLLHTKCRPGLKLSRDYQGTPAQEAVLHMPWWSEGILESKKMIISYDNLIRRLWLQGAIVHPATTSTATTDETVDLFGNNNQPMTTSSEDNTKTNIETLLNDDGMPPTPHEYWVSRLGFQQPDPVTDFRSGGVLSLAMLVWIVESCPDVFKRYARVPVPGDASVLPFGITCINVTDMMSKFLMLSKATDKMDTLLSHKPFWKMFADPSSLLACQELAMDMLADVVVELYQVRDAETDGNGKVTVFDFSHILAVTEKRVEYDLLGAGPTSVVELRQIHAKLKIKYCNQLQQKLQRVISSKKPATMPQQIQEEAAGSSDETQQPQQSSSEETRLPTISTKKVKDEVLKQVSGIGAVASSFTGNLLSKIKQPQTPSNEQQEPQQPQQSSSSSRGGLFANPFGFAAASLGNITSPKQQQDSNTEGFVSSSGDATSGDGTSTTKSNNDFNFFMDPHDSEDARPYSSTGQVTANNPIIASRTSSNDFLLVGADEWKTDDIVTTATTGVNNFSIDADEDDEELL